MARLIHKELKLHLIWLSVVPYAQHKATETDSEKTAFIIDLYLIRSRARNMINQRTLNV